MHLSWQVIDEAYFYENEDFKAECWWLTSVILVSWGLRLDGSQFQASLCKKVCDISFQWKKAGHGGACLSSQ
jgi:hypothetical protein